MISIDKRIEKERERERERERRASAVCSEKRKKSTHRRESVSPALVKAFQVFHPAKLASFYIAEHDAERVGTISA